MVDLDSKVDEEDEPDDPFKGKKIKTKEDCLIHYINFQKNFLAARGINFEDLVGMNNPGELNRICEEAKLLYCTCFSIILYCKSGFIVSICNYYVCFFFVSFTS